MFTASRIAAGVAVLALTGSLAFAVSPAGDRGPAAPGASLDGADPSAFAGFSGTFSCRRGLDGTQTWTDMGATVVGEEYPDCTLEVSDPRISGRFHAIHDYYKYGDKTGLSPRWGVRATNSVISNDDGSWVQADGWGYQQPLDHTMSYVARYQGTDAYEGLTALMIHSQDEWGLLFDVQGVIIPGDLPSMPGMPLSEPASD